MIAIRMKIACTDINVSRIKHHRSSSQTGSEGQKTNHCFSELIVNRSGQGFNRLGFRFPTPKRGSKSGSMAEAPKPQPSFVMKLFDRGVDLAQFDESTPLYPICRAWMHNKPHK